MKDDTISRQAALDALEDISVEVEDGDGFQYAKWRDHICNLPSAQPTGTNTVPVDDSISRRAAIELVQKYHGYMPNDINHKMWKEVKAMPTAQPGQRNARVFQGIIVEYPSISAYPEYEGKPYFSIKYTENGQEFIGYGTYKPEVLSEYLKEYFMLPTQPGCEDVVPRTAVEYICRKNTVSTNPYEHKYHDKFIQFMDDPEISDFGRWQHSNGFNTALVAVKCDLDKVPSVTPKQPERERGKWIGTEYDGFADGCPVYYEWKCSKCGCVLENDEPTFNLCPNCGARMEGDHHD